MTSHPSPDGISEERDVPPTGHDAYWNARIMCDGPSDNYSAGVWCARLNELVAAYGTLVRGASEDRALLAEWLDAIRVHVDRRSKEAASFGNGEEVRVLNGDKRQALQGWLANRANGTPSTEVVAASQENVDAANHLAARTPNQDSPNGR